MVVDNTRENCKSWQVIEFPPRPVVFIRIVGTHNTANEVFHCVHFECPSCEDNNQASGTPAKPNRKNREFNGATNLDAVAQPPETATEAEEVPMAMEDRSLQPE